MAARVLVDACVFIQHTFWLPTPFFSPLLSLEGRYIHVDKLACPDLCTSADGKPTVQTFVHGITHNDAHPRSAAPPCMVCGKVCERTSDFSERPFVKATLLDLSAATDEDMRSEKAPLVARTLQLIIRGESLCRQVALGQRIQGSGFRCPSHATKSSAGVCNTIEVHQVIRIASTRASASDSGVFEDTAGIIPADADELMESPWHLST